MSEASAVPAAPCRSFPPMPPRPSAPNLAPPPPAPAAAASSTPRSPSYHRHTMHRCRWLRLVRCLALGCWLWVVDLRCMDAPAAVRKLARPPPAACASMRAAVRVHALMCTHLHLHMHTHVHVHVRMGGACPRARPDPGWLYRRSRARNARGSRCICHVARLRKVGVVRRGISSPHTVMHVRPSSSHTGACRRYTKYGT